jgi:hypothetical protein
MVSGLLPKSAGSFNNCNKLQFVLFTLKLNPRWKNDAKAYMLLAIFHDGRIWMSTFWASIKDDSYRHNLSNKVTLRFDQSPQLTKEARAEILSAWWFNQWAEKEIKAYGNGTRPIDVTVHGFSTFDGSQDLSKFKDVVASVQTTTEDGTPTGRGKMLIARPLDLLLAAIEVTRPNISVPETYFLVTKSPRHGIPNPDTLGLPGGVRSSQGFGAQADARKLLEPCGLKQDSDPYFLLNFATIPAAVHEEAFVTCVKLKIGIETFVGLSKAVLKHNANKGPNDKEFALLSLEEAKKIATPPQTFDGRTPVDTLVQLPLAHYRLLQSNM